MKASKKMLAAIAKVEKKYGELDKYFFVEWYETNRVGRGFYDGCQLTSNILQSVNIIVAHDGTIYY
jgi:hypothetical protein